MCFDVVIVICPRFDFAFEYLVCLQHGLPPQAAAAAAAAAAVLTVSFVGVIVFCVFAMFLG